MQDNINGFNKSRSSGSTNHRLPGLANVCTGNLTHIKLVRLIAPVPAQQQQNNQQKKGGNQTVAKTFWRSLTDIILGYGFADIIV